MRDVGIVVFMRVEKGQPSKAVYARKLKEIKEGKALV